MLKNYLLTIEELNNEAVVSENPTTFNMNKVVDSAKGGDTTLLEQLYQATKIGVYECQISLGKKTNGQEVVRQSCICTPKKGRNVAKENAGLILPTHDELVAHLVSYHNEHCEQTGMEEISLDEIKALYQAAQQERTL